jgi:hypothetical protein
MIKLTLILSKEMLELINVYMVKIPSLESNLIGIWRGTKEKLLLHHFCQIWKTMIYYQIEFWGRLLLQ